MRGAVLVSLVLLSGCLGDSSADDPADPDAGVRPEGAGAGAGGDGVAGGAGAQAQAVHFEETFAMLAIDASVMGQNYAMMQDSDNCIRLHDAGGYGRGLATVTWDAAPELPPMALSLRQGTDVLATSSEGTGTVTLEWEALDVDSAQHSAYLIWHVAASAPAGVAYEVEGTLTLAFDFTGVGEPAPEPGWTCG